MYNHRCHTLPVRDIPIIDPDHHIFIACEGGAWLIACEVVVNTRGGWGWACEGGAEGGSGCVKVGLSCKIAGGAGLPVRRLACGRNKGSEGGHNACFALMWRSSRVGSVSSIIYSHTSDTRRERHEYDWTGFRVSKVVFTVTE